MHPVGYTTGALCRGDWQTALCILRDSRFTAIELGTLREWEFMGLLSHLPTLDVSKYDAVSVHCPKIQKMTEEKLTEDLSPIYDRGWNITVHPYVIKNPKLWKKFGSQLCIENMGTSTKSSKASEWVGQDVDGLSPFFNDLPDASMCFDIGHAIQMDETTELAENLIDSFGDRVKIIHLSKVNPSGEHLPLTVEPIRALGRVITRLPMDCAIIIESDARETYDKEVILTNGAFAESGIRVLW